MTLSTRTLTSTDIKVEVLAWLRYAKGMELVCTEVGGWSADIIGVRIDTGSVTEVEVKVSIADLRRELSTKKAKHFRYANGPWVGVPNYFYVAVPEALVEKAQPVVADLHPRYGLVAVPESGRVLGRSATVTVKARALHDKRMSPAFQRVVSMRMSSELVGLHALYNEGLTRINSEALGAVTDHLELLNSKTPEPGLDLVDGAGV